MGGIFMTSRRDIIRDNRTPYWEWLEQTQKQEGVLLTAEFAERQPEFLVINGILGEGGWSWRPLNYKESLQQPRYIEYAPHLVSCQLVSGKKRQAREMVRDIYHSRPSPEWNVRDALDNIHKIRPNVVVFRPFSRLYRNPLRCEIIDMIVPAVYAFIDKHKHEKFVEKIIGSANNNREVPGFHYNIIGAKDFKEEVWKLVPGLRKELRD